MLEGASSHKAKDLTVPENIRLLSLPGYSPALNPEEHIWDELREKAFPNAVLDDMDLVVQRLKEGMNTPRLRRRPPSTDHRLAVGSSSQLDSDLE